MTKKERDALKIKAAKVLLEAEDIPSISQLVKRKHLTIEQLGQVMGRSKAYAQQCMNNPGRFRIEDLAAIAAQLDLSNQYITKMALNDFRDKKKPR